MTKFTRSLYSTSALGVALALASPAYAQAAPEPAAPAAAPTATDDKDAIVVTGFRAALRSATAMEGIICRIISSFPRLSFLSTV